MDFLKELFKALSSKIILPSYKTGEWENKNFNLQKVKIKNQKISREIENYCKQKDDVLTFSEFINKEMYGEHGFYKNHSIFGKTSVNKLWPEAILKFCRKHKIKSVLEIGSGDGSLAENTLKMTKAKKLKLRWIGIETNEKLFLKVKKKNIPNLIFHNNLNGIKKEKHLVIFPYSLDSMGSEVLINYSKKKSTANKLLGIAIEDNFLKEKLLTAEQLTKRSIWFDQGKITKNNKMFDFSLQQLYPIQRLYVPIDAFLTFLNVLEKIEKGSFILIIDELKDFPNTKQSNHLGLPKALNKLRGEYTDILQGYESCGNNLWYFPLYFKHLMAFLRQAGIENVQEDIEMRMAEKMKDKKWEEKPGIHYCHAIIGQFKKTPKEKITFPSL